MNFFKLFFGRGCIHSFSWPRVDEQGRHYQVCSKCGVAYEYDWAAMTRTQHLWTNGNQASSHDARTGYQA